MSALEGHPDHCSLCAARSVASLRLLREFIYDRIDAWHDSETSAGLPEWLGWTWDEYMDFAEGRVS